jgi:hypothetical protein
MIEAPNVNGNHAWTWQYFRGSRCPAPKLNIYVSPEGHFAGNKKLTVSGIYLFISNYKNRDNTFLFCLPRETHPVVYFGLILFFKRLEIAHL